MLVYYCILSVWSVSKCCFSVVLCLRDTAFTTLCKTETCLPKIWPMVPGFGAEGSNNGLGVRVFVCACSHLQL